MLTVYKERKTDCVFFAVAIICKYQEIEIIKY